MAEKRTRRRFTHGFKTQAVGRPSFGLGHGGGRAHSLPKGRGHELSTLPKANGLIPSIPPNSGDGSGKVKQDEYSWRRIHQLGQILARSAPLRCYHCTRLRPGVLLSSRDPRSNSAALHLGLNRVHQLTGAGRLHRQRLCDGPLDPLIGERARPARSG
jgi:hypothetical protein